MHLFFLLLLPVALGLAGLLFSKGRVTWKEFLVHEGVMVLLIVIGYYVALHHRTSDTEIWSGVIVTKSKGETQCCHSYECDCHDVCKTVTKGTGKSKHKERECHKECDTCYRHGSRKSGWNGDVEWDAYSSNNEHVYHDGCNAPGASAPKRWEAIAIGEPTAVEHEYTNYIKGNPDSILRREGAAERFKGRLPPYPRVYDRYRIDRFLALGVLIPDLAALNARLSEINGRLGAAKQVNVVVIVVRESDQRYLEALRETWLGGKKNDFVIVIGAPDFPEIAWAGVLSWTKNEDLKIAVRNRLLDLKTFDGSKTLDLVEEEVGQKFARRHMSDFEYLKSTIEPTAFATQLLFILGLLLAAGLQIYFWFHDPFGDGHEPYAWTRRIRIR